MARLILIFIVLCLVVLFVVSFTLFIRRILINQAIRNDRLRKIEEKLDLLLKNQGK